MLLKTQTQNKLENINNPIKYGLTDTIIRLCIVIYVHYGGWINIKKNISTFISLRQNFNKTYCENIIVNKINQPLSYAID